VDSTVGSTNPTSPTTPDEPDDPFVPDPGSPSNEPPGFVQVFNKPHDSLDEYDTVSGRIAATGGDYVFTYPAGSTGGVGGYGTEIGVGPGRAVMAAPNHGPYIYYLMEGVEFSSGWQGHNSAVNKMWLARRPTPTGNGPVVVARGADAAAMTVVLNTQGTYFNEFYGNVVNFTYSGPSPSSWNGNDWSTLFPNFASPSLADATIVRGERHDIEQLIYVGTPGNSDGWYKVWNNGVLILDYRNVPIVGPGEPRAFRGINFDPIWGGTGDTVVSEQTLKIARFYASEGSSV
jgi:hypothetical protein